MSKGHEVEEEYLNLRSKVEDRIRELEGKLPPGQVQSSSHLPPGHHPIHHNLPPGHHNLPSGHHNLPPGHHNLPPRHHRIHHNLPPGHHQMHHSHCHHGCRHSPCPPNYQQQTGRFMYPGNAEMASSEVMRVSSPKQGRSGYGQANEVISTALAVSLNSQKQISDSIKAINQKIQNISVHQNRSYLSDAFSESVTKRRNKARPYTNLINIESENQRRYSEIRTDSLRSNKAHSQAGEHLHRVRGRPAQHLQPTPPPGRKGKCKGKDRGKSKSSSKFKSEYFLSFWCPVHSPERVGPVSPEEKQVYRDSQHRNRKHEKNHLVQSFNRQQRSKKQLIDRISQKAYYEYGRN